MPISLLAMLSSRSLFSFFLFLFSCILHLVVLYFGVLNFWCLCALVRVIRIWAHFHFAKNVLRFVYKTVCFYIHSAFKIPAVHYSSWRVKTARVLINIKQMIRILLIIC